MASPPTPTAASPTRGSALEVFTIFLRLGLTSFGGPVAHLGYFRAEFVSRRRWLTEQSFAELLAIAQSLPGPASSQTGYMIGLLRAGLPGALAAWLGFTTPSAILMLAFAFGHSLFTGPLGNALLHGLQVAAVAVVAQAVLAMRRTLAPDIPRLALALIAAAVIFLAPASIGTLLAIALGALLGLTLRTSAEAPQLTLAAPLSRRAALIAALLFCALACLCIVVRSNDITPLTVFSRFARSGALVFGGGHVVLPMLESAVVSPGWVPQPTFLAGYGAAQALPGPLFTFAAFLGASIGAAQPNPHPIALGLTALVALFLPGLLLSTAVLPFWTTIRTHASIRRAMNGINAAVVGILAAALIRPVASSAVHTWLDLSLAIAAFFALVLWKLPPWLVVLATAALATVAAVARAA
jgi:chromate transporter